MKKRFISMLLVAALLLCILPGAQAAGLISFVGVNDTIPISLPAEAAPYYSGGVLYIPYTAFQASPNGVVISNNVDQNTLVLFTRNERLVYDLEAGTVADEDGNVSSISVSYRGGLLFIPAVQAASHFGLSVSLLTSKTGCSIIRFTNGQQVYSNDKFVENAENLISYILEHNAKQEASGGENTEVQNGETQDVPGELGPATVYVAFTGEAVSEETLAYLEAMELQAAFFLTTEQFELQKELVWSIYAAGHTIGLTVGAGETDVEAALTAANEAMDKVLFCRSILVLLPEGVSLESDSYILLRTSNAMTAADILRQEEQVPRLLVCSSHAAEGLTPLVNSGAFLPQLLETTQLS